MNAPMSSALWGMENIDSIHRYFASESNAVTTAALNCFVVVTQGGGISLDEDGPDLMDIEVHMNTIDSSQVRR